MMHRCLVVAGSLIPTPFLLLISSSSALYLRNQDVLHHRVEVLFPFVVAFSAMLLVGFFLYALSDLRHLRFALTAYYVTGPVFLIYAVGRNLQPRAPFLAPLYQTTAGLAAWLGILVFAIIVVGIRVPRNSMAKALALFGALLLASESFVFCRSLERPRSSPQASFTEIQDNLPTDRPSLPNIYHLMMDGFQTDFFETARSPQSDDALDGFMFFPENTAVYHSTSLSLTSVFLGRKYAYDRRRADYVGQLFNARSSYLYWLKKQGYSTLGFFPGSSSQEGRDPADARQEIRFFDHVVSMDTAVTNELSRLDETTFRNLWLYSVLPEPLRETGKQGEWFHGLDEEDLRLLEGERLLPSSAQAISRMGFENILKEERNLPDHGRYTYIHLLIPHWPFNLEADCSLAEGGAKTGPVQQTKCGLLLIEKFVTTLKELGRFEDSMILIHGDHGGFFRMRNGALSPFPRSRSLRSVLLLKPFGKPSGSGFLRSEARTSLLDIKPVIMKSVVSVQRGDGAPQGDAAIDPNGLITPHVEGETLESARLILSERGFTVGSIVEAYLASHPPDTIIAQDPPPYAFAREGAGVSLLLSQGSHNPAELMPDCIGRQIADILPAINDREREGNLASAQVHYVEQVGFPRGRVVAQSPKAGTRLGSEVQISLYVSKGS